MYFKQGATIERSNSTLTSGATLTLVNTSETYQYFTGTTTHTMKLPDATNLKQGMRWEVINQSTGSITVQDGSSATIGTVPTTSTVIFRLITPGTIAGSWDMTTATAGSGTGVLSSADAAAFAAGASQTFTLTSKPLKYNPEEIAGNFWTTLSPISSARAHGASASLNGFGYTIGGLDSSLTTVLSTVERFDDSLNYWLAKSGITARNQSVGFSYNGFIYCIDGTSTTLIANATNTVQKYNDATDAWALKAAHPVSRTAQFSFSLSNGYTAGGVDTANNDTSEVNAYDDVADAWYSRQSIPTTRGQGGSFDLNKLGYIVFGSTGGGSTVNTANTYNEANNSWNSIATGSSVQENSGASSNGFGYSFGGFNGTTTVATVSEFFPALNTWSAKASMSSDKYWAYAFTVNGIAYSAGGRQIPAAADITQVQKYTNTSVFNLNILSRSTLTPNSISASVLLNGITQSVPVRVRTDGDNWKLLMSNGGSATKTGETLSVKFQPSGLVYTVGGSDASSVTNATSQSYNLVANTWTTRASMNIARLGGYGAPADGLLYALAGANAASVNQTNGEKFDEIKNTWTNLTVVVPVALYYGGGEYLNGFVYLVGGATQSSAASVATNYQYNTVADSIATKTAMGTSRYSPAVFTAAGKIYAAGGLVIGGAIQSTAEDYSDATNSWTNTPNSLITGVYATAGGSLNGFGYVVGGTTGTYQNLVQRYDPSVGAWSSVAILSQSIVSPGVLRNSGFLFRNGGSTTVSPVPDAQYYNDGANIWTTIASLGAAKNGPVTNATPGSYRNYEMRAELPALYAGLGNTSGWITKSNMVRVQASDSNFVIGDQIYLTLGLDGGLVDPSGRTNVTQRYNSIIDTWYFDVPNSMGIGDSGGASTGNVLYGLGYCMGFNTAAGSLTAQCVKYIPDIKSWAAVANMLVNSGSGNITAPLNGKMYNNGNHPSSGSTRMDMYDPVANAWTNKTSSTTTHYAGMAASNGGFFYSVGDATVTTSVEKFSDAANAWTTMANLPNGVENAAGLNLKDRFQAVGGISGVAVAFVQEFNPLSNTWQQKTVLPSATYAARGGTLNTGINVAAGGNNGAYVATTYAQVPAIKNAILSAVLTIT